MVATGGELYTQQQTDGNSDQVRSQIWSELLELLQLQVYVPATHITFC